MSWCKLTHWWHRILILISERVTGAKVRSISTLGLVIWDAVTHKSCHINTSHSNVNQSIVWSTFSFYIYRKKFNTVQSLLIDNLVDRTSVDVAIGPWSHHWKYKLYSKVKQIVTVWKILHYIQYTLGISYIALPPKIFVLVAHQGCPKMPDWVQELYL